MTYRTPDVYVTGCHIRDLHRNQLWKRPDWTVVVYADVENRSAGGSYPVALTLRQARAIRDALAAFEAAQQRAELEAQGAVQSTLQINP